MSKSLNPFGRPAFEQTEYERHIDPQTGTLINKFGIRDHRALELLEREITADRSAQSLPTTAKTFTFEGFRAIHHHIFQDVYKWAGNIRTYTTGRNEAPFAKPEHIEREANKLFQKLNAANNFKDYSKSQFAEHAAEFICEINALHPFIDGNGRTMRRFLRHLAKENGFQLELKSTDKDYWNEASRIGFESCQYRKMENLLFARLIDRRREHERRTSLVKPISSRTNTRNRSRGDDGGRGRER